MSKIIKTISISIILILCVGMVGIAKTDTHNTANSLVQKFENLYKSFMKLSLPGSLDKYFVTQKPEVPGSEWTGEMFIQAGAFDGIVTNLQENDMANAAVSYTVFSSEYKNISKKVPEWKGYFDIATVNKLGKDLKANNTPAAFQDIGTIGATCNKCHGDNQPQVWAKYYWRNFNTVNVSTSQGNLSWSNAMTALAGSFDGIGTNIAEGKQNDANDSFNQFKALYTNVKTACSNCHDTPRYYYVSDDVFAEIDQMGGNIAVDNIQNVQAIQQDLGTQCYKCHVLHMPAQDMKDKMGN
jgi:cytochrome c556